MKNWRNFTRTTGIYKIVCSEENRVYVGQSKDIGSRWKQHLYQLENNKHHCISLQEAWNKYGFQAFSFQVVLKCKKTELTVKEQEVWDKQESCYNGRPTSHTYPEHTEETKKKLSEGRKGMKFSEEHKKNLSEKKKGIKLRPHTKERKENISKAKSIAVLQQDKEGNVIQEWYGISEAARKLGLQTNAISACCKGKRKTHGGFRWSYK